MQDQPSEHDIDRSPTGLPRTFIGVPLQCAIDAGIGNDEMESTTDAEAERDAVKAELDSLRSHHASIIMALYEIDNDVFGPLTVKEGIAELKGERDAANESLRKTQAALVEKSAEMHRLQAILTEYDAQQRLLEAEITRLHARIRELEQRIFPNATPSH